MRKFTYNFPSLNRKIFLKLEDYAIKRLIDVIGCLCVSAEKRDFSR